MTGSNTYIGRSVERLEDLRFLRGQGIYVDDLRPPDLLHAVILRSAVAHGRIRSIDGAAARALPGVRAIITAADLPGPVPTIPLRQEPSARLRLFEQPVIAGDRVRFVGEPIAVVVAATAAIAEDALDLIDLDIEPLPIVADRHAAARDDVLLHELAGTNRASTLTSVLGDVEAAFADAPYTRRECFHVQRHTAVPMECRGLLAAWDADARRLSLSGATKVTFANRRVLAAQLGLAETDIDMVENDVGGGFGVRGEFYPEDFLIPFAAMRLGRPVKWIEDRREHLTAANHARDVACELEIACTRDGTILGLRGEAWADLGAYIRTNGATPMRNVLQVMSGPYRIPHIRVEGHLLTTNKTPIGTYRGPGRYETDFFRERLLDMAAADLGIDRVLFRRKNLVREAEIPYALPTVLPYDIRTSTDSGDYAMTLDRCLGEIGWAEKARFQGRLVEGRYHGLGVGCYIEGGASGPRENARLALEPDGRVAVYVGSSAIGQGLETAFAQIAADALEWPIDRIRGVFHGSTAYVSEGFGSFSSRSTVLGGSAILDAAANLRAAVRVAGAARLGCAPEAAQIAEDRVVGPDGRAVTLAGLVDAPLVVDGTFASNTRTYSYGCHAAHVAVDPRTAHVAVLDYVAVEDVGRMINPAMLHGQAMGAIVQGLGGVFLEQLVYDETAQLLTASLVDYLLPTASDYPAIRCITLEAKPSPHNPLGAKGAGEGGIIPVGGVIANAVADALAPLGVVPRALPLSPSNLWRLLDDAKAQRALEDRREHLTSVADHPAGRSDQRAPPSQPCR